MQQARFLLLLRTSLGVVQNSFTPGAGRPEGVFCLDVQSNVDIRAVWEVFIGPTLQATASAIHRLMETWEIYMDI